MKLEMFFEKFDLFLDAQNAITKMRELVLQLAVQGALVEQNPNEASAKECIQHANKALIDSIPDETINTPYGWLALPLGGLIASNTGGGTPSKQNADYWDGPIPWASVKDVQSSKYLMSTIDSITETGLKNSSSNLIPPNRLIVVTRMGLGKLAINTVPVAINQDLRAIEPTSAFDLDFAYILLKSLKLVGSGVTVKGITVDKLHATRVLTPPVAEQKRIVAKVDELMALCDRLEAQQQERQARHAAVARAALSRFAEAPTPANLELLFHNSYTIAPADLRKSILTLAVKGKLIPQDPDDESAQRLFLGLKPLRSDSPDIDSTPNQWKLCTYRSLTSLVTSGSRGWKEFYSKSGAIFIRTQNIKTDRLILDDVAYVDLPKSAEGMRAQVLKDDILITITGANVTKAARVEDRIPEAYISQHIALTRPRWPEMSPWIYLCFISHGSARGALEQLAYGDKPGLNLNNIRDLVLPLPPLAEQQRIVAKVDQLMALVEQLEMQLSATKTASIVLLDAAIYELLNANSNVIEFPRAKREPLSARVDTACYVIQKMAGGRYFGRTAFAKTLYLAETHVGLDLDGQPQRKAAGPLDPWIYKFEEQGKNEHWFKTVESKTTSGKQKFSYQPRAALSSQAALASTWMTLDQHAELDRLLDLFADKKTDDVEIIATLFAVWNDALIDGKSPTNAEIIHEFRENWHKSKERFSPEKLQQWLEWMAQHKLIPKGIGPRTQHQRKLLP